MDKKFSKSSGNSKAARFFRKNVYYLLLTFSLVAAAAVIIVTLALTRNRGGDLPVVIDPPGDEIEVPVVVTPPTMLVPIQGSYKVSKPFAHDRLLYSATLKLWQTHSGIDLQAERGTEVVSILDGTVEDVITSMLDGSVVKIRHSEKLVTVYKSLSADVKVTKGQSVTRGQVIGTVSATMLSEIKDGPHLHFEILVDGVHADPVSLIPELGDK